MPDAALMVVVTGSVIATIVDIRTRRIPNVLTAAMACTGLALAASGISELSVWASVLGLVVGFALMMPGHVLGATGAGDVKLMAAIGANVGPALAISAFLFSAIAGGFLAVFVALQRRRLTATLSRTGKLVAGPAGVNQEIRAAGASNRFAYGPAIAAGSIIAVLMR